MINLTKDNDVDELERELEKVINQRNELKLEIDFIKNEFKVKLRSLEIERDRYKLRCTSLTDQMLIGIEPRRGLCTIVKCQLNNLQTEWTKNVKRLYDELCTNYGDNMISDHHEELSESITKSIRKFLEINQDKNYINPLIQIKRNTLIQDKVMKKRVIKKGYRIPELVGQYGIYANMNIPKDVVLGKYIGFECTNKEWGEIFDYTNADAKHGEYLYSFNIDQEMDDNHDGSRQITIDPLEGRLMDMHNNGRGRDLKLLYVNDIRQDIFNPEPSTEDIAIQNTRFVVVKIFGWPSVFVITTKRIRKGKELLLDYGGSYSVLLKQNKRWSKMINASKKQITNNIIGDMNIDNNYTIE